ncbi:hypothetical protein OESDEN_06745 [Oesophagostomum dentatum]|uniref:Uncharacterized protein n=1 Tax=Oesophagostomum dentatum TaxID=61180 RepID=A0A0B1T7W8_OESDE|nr:hypothetical protein OESDEN_06745 [Oesophagostomum dentatum]
MAGVNKVLIQEGEEGEKTWISTPPCSAWSSTQSSHQEASTTPPTMVNSSIDTGQGFTAAYAVHEEP